MNVYDMKLDGDTLDLVVSNGDFVMDESTNQHQHLIVMASKGDFKEFPLAGAAIENYLYDETTGDFVYDIKRSLVYDGMNVDSVTFENGSLNIQAHYE